MNAPLPPQRPPADPRGSLGLGIALAWACLFAGYTLCAIVLSLIINVDPHMGDGAVGIAVLLALLPWLAMIGLIVWMAAHGRTRTALGVGVGIASIVGVALLLVAACFGILSSTSFR